MMKSLQICNLLWLAEMFIHETTLVNEHAQYFYKEY
jgi:hypothetical protein